MAGANLAFSKVVATPTPNAWSQAYSAGSLFAAISLQSSSASLESDLNTIGKDLISTLESEFFTLERKDLESIKQAITTTISRLPEGVSLSFVICYLNENILYLYATGGGKAVLKRGDKIGTVLEGEEEKEVKSASGYVQNNDIIILQTKQFLRIIASSTLASSLDKNIPEEIAEELAPHVHDKSEGGASAVILSYKEGEAESVAETEETTIDEVAATETTVEISAISKEEFPSEEQISKVEIPNLENTPEEISEVINPTQPVSQSAPIENPMPERLQTTQETASPFLADRMPKKRFSIGIGGIKRLSRSRKLILLVGSLLVVVIIIIALLAIRNQQSSNTKELFEGIYNQAQDNYDEGVSLRDLNASLSQESFKKAQAILEKNKDTFTQGSDEDTKIEELLDKVTQEVGEDSSGGGETSTASEVDKSESKLLSYELDNSGASYFTQNKDFVYFLDGKGINKIDKGNDEKEVVTKKDWETEGGIGVFGSNIYVLDKADGILKFVPSADAYSSTDYFSSDAPDFKDAAAMAIDGSVYVLWEDGSLKKYTRGAEDDFTVSGLEKPLSSPTRIWTTEDQDNIYILDKGNSRIIVLDKEGKFVKAYSADIIKAAKDIDVAEADKKIFVLSGDKVYKIDIK